jgi:hypothetical protein
MLIGHLNQLVGRTKRMLRPYVNIKDSVERANRKTAIQRESFMPVSGIV